MNVKIALLRRVCLVGLLLLGWLGSLQAAEVNVLRTNKVDRWITNVIEVRVPLNLFINEYRTNWLEEKRTNVVEVDAYRTNFLTAYQTNWKTFWVTNEVGVDRFDTNYLVEYQTNSRTLFVTNWETVLVMKTNWIFQPVTNVAQIDMIAKRPTGAQPTSVRQNIEARPNVEPAGSSTLSSDLIIEATTTGRVNTNQVEVQLRASWGADSRTALQVQRWKVEREDATILSFGQEAVFRRMLPPGRYRVELRAQKDGSGPVLSARATLVLSPHEALIEPQLASRQ